jgi:hypothetical protein
MNKRQIQIFVMRFLDAYGCSIMEKTPSSVTVKLSPEADKEMTGRSYYWNFVERTGAPAETMTYTFILDPELEQEQAALKAAQSAKAPPPTAAPQEQGQPPDNSILGRYFGFVPTTLVSRVPRDEITFGSRRFEQLFSIAGAKGRFVHLFEEPFTLQVPSPAFKRVYNTWLCINFKAEFACDMKRSEIHSIAIQLNSGEIREHFHKQLLSKSFAPKLPANIFILPDIVSLPKAVQALELVLERKISNYDHRWAQEANERHQIEVERIDSYYNGLLQAAEPDKRQEIEAQFINRREEIDWQYKPRILVSVINCGLFHLNSEEATRNGLSR